MRLRRRRQEAEVIDPPVQPGAANAALERAMLDAEEALKQREEMHLRVEQRRQDFLAPEILAVMQSRRNK